MTKTVKNDVDTYLIYNNNININIYIDVDDDARIHAYIHAHAHAYVRACAHERAVKKNPQKKTSGKDLALRKFKSPFPLSARTQPPCPCPHF